MAIRHGNYANVFAWETVERMNIKAKMWQDLVDDQPFTRADIITLQDPQNMASRNLDAFKYLQDGQDAQLTKDQEEERKSGNINAGALGSMGDKVLKAKAAVERARKARESGADINRSSSALTKTSAMAAPTHKPMIQDKKLVPNSAAYTTGKAAASFTSTGLTPETSGDRALLTEEEYMLKPKRVKAKGYARMETNLGDLTLELFPEFAPKAVWNFVKLSQKGYYRGVAFHRNIPNFMIQGGDPSGTGKGGASIWGKYFDDEFEGPQSHKARGIGKHLLASSLPANVPCAHTLQSPWRTRARTQTPASSSSHTKPHRTWTANTPSSPRSCPGSTSSPAWRTYPPTAPTVP